MKDRKRRAAVLFVPKESHPVDKFLFLFLFLFSFLKRRHVGAGAPGVAFVGNAGRTSEYVHLCAGKLGSVYPRNVTVTRYMPWKPPPPKKNTLVLFFRKQEPAVCIQRTQGCVSMGRSRQCSPPGCATAGI